MPSPCARQRPAEARLNPRTAQSAPEGTQREATQISPTRAIRRYASVVDGLDPTGVPLLATDLPAWFVTTIAFLFGAAWGSFFNVAIHRWPRDMSVVDPPSHCPHCEQRIPARFNVPIVSYLILRGRAACCGAPVSVRYPVVELLGAVVCVALARRFIVEAPSDRGALDAALLTLCYFAFAGGLIIAAFVDLAHMEIPDEVSLPGAALGLATAAWRVPPGPESAALGAGAGFLLVYVVFVWGYEQLTGRRGMGEGDAKLLLMVGAFLGWQGVLFSLFAGAVQGLVVAAFAIVRGVPLGPSEPLPTGGHGESTDGSAPTPDREADSDPPPRWIGHLKLPFGPFLSLAALEYLFFGPALSAQWLRLVESALGALGLA